MVRIDQQRRLMKPKRFKKLNTYKNVLWKLHLSYNIKTVVYTNIALHVCKYMCIYKIPPPTHTTDQTKLLAQTYSLLKSFSYSTHFFLPSHRLSSSGIHPDQALVCTRAISKCLPTICSSERSRKSLGILGSVDSVMDAFLVSLNWLGARFPPARVLAILSVSTKDKRNHCFPIPVKLHSIPDSLRLAVTQRCWGRWEGRVYYETVYDAKS